MSRIRPTSRLAACLAFAVLAWSVPRSSAAAAPALARPEPAVLAEARALVEAMKGAERGPYTRIRWYCKDGAVLPPEPYACRNRGGGRQHAEYSPERQRLAALGWRVGTIFAALDWEELWDGERRHQRLRELPLERYLVETDDGWVLRRARYYRGRVQVEDEERAGRDLLLRLLSRGEWVRRNFLLAREAVRTIPHNAGGERTAGIRRRSQEIAERDRSFERIRIKIHTAPGAEDLQAIRQWIDEALRRNAPGELVASAERLAAEVTELYAGGGARLLRALAALAPGSTRAELEPLVRDVVAAPAARRLEILGGALGRVRELMPEAADGAAALALADLSLELESEAEKAAFELLTRASLTRAELAATARPLIAAGFGCGLFSARERDALDAGLEALAGRSEAPTAAYVSAVESLRRATGWGMGTVRYTFAEALARYGALEPRANRFVDDLLRGSPLLPLAEAASRLAADTDRLAGTTHRLFGTRRAGVLALNPGVAVGPLRLATVDDSGHLSGLERSDVALLPRTVSELDPVAGILTLAEGNLLSHIQILARNLGIPNASIPPVLAAEVTAGAGAEVLLAVGSDGSVLLERVADLPAAVRAALGSAPAAAPPAKLDAPRPDLTVRRPLVLSELSAELSGRVVGPKAANLGELARTFPGRVAPAVALPFGLFDEHVSGGPDSPRARLLRAFAAHRADRLDADGLAAEVEAVRRAIAASTLTPALREQLSSLLAIQFGPGGGHGVFIRSDTNVEDLPGFTGAGLNETVPNVVGLEAQLAAIPRVWASPFSARAMAWRSAILNRPEEVYSSVLIMRSVPAEKSGVMVTADLATRGAGLTVAVAWGVGGAVDNEAAETVVLRPDGSVTLVGEAKAPYRRRLGASGGVEWVPAESGRVLTDAETAALRRLAAEVRQRLEPARGPDGGPLPWDIEFGFVGGELTLFQIRPLVERGQARADRILGELLPPAARQPALTRLDAPVGRPAPLSD